MELTIGEIREKAVKLVHDFNYEAVLDYMRENKKSYWYTDGEPPSISDLKTTAFSVMTHAMVELDKKREATHVGSGGFNVYIFPEWGGVKLTFEPIEFKKSSY